MPRLGYLNKHTVYPLIFYIKYIFSQGYHEYIDENLPPESPYLYGLHPNAEIGFLTVTSEKLFRTVLEMQPKESDSGGGTGVSREEKVRSHVISWDMMCHRNIED